MIRKAFIMSVHAGYEQEYKNRHNPIWKELEEEIHRHGGRKYSIFLDRITKTLFAYIEIEDEQLWKKIDETPVCKRWHAYMKEIMPSNPDDTPVSRDLEEVFHID
ncbi:MAG TPA: L-rhamnose mutarotase [bacterium]|nr:L-rhamnose mutarotase [bacterium]